MTDEDQALMEKVIAVVRGGLTESSAVNFLALLSITEYERLIALFEQDTDGTLGSSARKKLLIILKKLRDAKRGASNSTHT